MCVLKHHALRMFDFKLNTFICSSETQLQVGGKVGDCLADKGLIEVFRTTIFTKLFLQFS